MPHMYLPLTHLPPSYSSLLFLPSPPPFPSSLPFLTPPSSSCSVRCGGCGSKVGAQVLSRALSKVRKLLHTRDEVIAGIGGKTGGTTCAAIS